MQKNDLRYNRILSERGACLAYHICLSTTLAYFHQIYTFLIYAISLIYLCREFNLFVP